MTIEVVQLSNLGFKVVVQVTDSAGVVRNLTGATNLKLKLRCTKARAGKEFAGAAEDLANGKISYTVAASDIDEEGLWQAQAYYELGTWKGHTEAVDAFLVERNLA